MLVVVGFAREGIQWRDSSGNVRAWDAVSRASRGRLHGVAGSGRFLRLLPVVRVRGHSVYREVLGIRAARSLIGASAASQLGNWLYNAALLGYVYSVTHSAGWVGAATICRLLPYVVLGPVGGVIAD